MLVRALPYLITATLLVVLATVVGVAWALSHALVYYQALSAFAAASRGTSVGALFEYRLPRSALLAVHDVYAGVVGNIARHHLIDASTGHMVRSGWDVSTHLEFTLIWSRMVAQGYLHNTSSPYQRLVVDVGAMYVASPEPCAGKARGLGRPGPEGCRGGGCVSPFVHIPLRPHAHTLACHLMIA
jgi:hypothetical protein